MTPEPTGELLPYEPSEASAQWGLLYRIARVIGDTEFVPKSYRGKPYAIVACLAYGRELGIGEMQALQSINVIDGKPSLAPEAMRGLVFAAGHTITTDAYTDDVVALVGTRKDGASARVQWSMEDARRAGLMRGDPRSAWVKYPRAMLLARATSELCRLLFPDVIAGASYAPDGLGGENPPADDSDLDVLHEGLGSEAAGPVGESGADSHPAPATAPTLEELGTDMTLIVAMGQQALDDANPHKAEFVAWLRAKGYWSDPQKWTEAQAAQVLTWLTSEPETVQVREALL